LPGLRQSIQQRTEHHQIRELRQLRLQLALFVMVFDGAAKIHAPLVLLLAAGASFEIDIGFAVLGHVLFSRNRVGEISIEAVGDALKSVR